jgi:regulator of sigma E protease
MDGGRLVFLFIELIRGKPVKAEHEGMVHFIGIVALMVLMVIVTFNDIVRIITGG